MSFAFNRTISVLVVILGTKFAVYRFVLAGFIVRGVPRIYTVEFILVEATFVASIITWLVADHVLKLACWESVGQKQKFTIGDMHRVLNHTIAISPTPVLLTEKNSKN